MNQTINEVLGIDPYSLTPEEKGKKLNPLVIDCFNHHYTHCEKFRIWCDKQEYSPNQTINNLSELPYLPVNAFKSILLSSVPDDQIVRKLSSSATSGLPSQIPIDQITRQRQMKASLLVMSNFIGYKRKPFFILDEQPRKNSDNELQARAAATRGFLVCASSSDYFLHLDKDKLVADVNKFEAKLSELSTDEICIFGFTYILYSYFIKLLKKKKVKFNLKKAKIVHIGGWKKLASEKVPPEQFKKDISETLGVESQNIIDFYGFTEQMGVLFAECSQGIKHIPTFAEIIIRDFQTLKAVSDNNKGLIQVLSPIPNSFPGASIITEDVGKIVLRDNCACGRRGPGFKILGRAQKAEARGCGDLLSEKVFY